VRGGAGQRARARLLLEPEVTIEREPRGAVLTSGPARALMTTSAPLTVDSAIWAPDFGVRRETRQLVLDYGPAPCAGSFTLERIP
jgi:hypothetical protein